MFSPSTDALTTGTARSASTVALRMNDRYVSFAPARSYSAFLASRICATRWKLTSNTECTCADVRRLTIMCSAIFLRIVDIGALWPARAAAGFGGGAGDPAGREDGAGRRASTAGSVLDGWPRAMNP